MTVIATYRVQLSKSFGLQDLMGRVEYLHALGISHLYLSPLLESVSGSDHGYDVVDFTRISRERGGEESLRALDRKLRSLDPPMGMIFDIVPNHMAAHLENPYWCDVLQKGRASPYWRFFDFRLGVGGHIELPVLRDKAEALIASGEIRLRLDDADVVAECGGNRYPLSPSSARRLLRRCTASGASSLTVYLDNLPPADVAEVLAAQEYAFVPAVMAARSVSYRRFFDISGLIGLRMEDPEVFNAVHRKIFELVRELPSVAGVRVDHIDGLAAPGEYLKRLKERVPAIWVEKILARGENLPPWPVIGTTGYDFIDASNRLLLDAGGFAKLDGAWRKYAASPWPGFAACVRASKREALETLFPAEVERLTRLMADGPDLAMKAAIIKLTAALPVYRLYGASPKCQPQLAAALAGLRRTTAMERILTALSAPRTKRWQRFLREWQQLSGAAMAKGLEDRAHYRYTPLSALNEVGCVPMADEMDIEDFCALMNSRAQSLNAMTTHDTKRSGDARARLLALADMPQAWIAFRRRVDLMLPSPAALRGAAHDLFLQSVLATWPLGEDANDAYVARIADYMRKAAREEAIDTGWSWPDAPYEEMLDNFIHRALYHRRFRRQAAGFAERLSAAGALTSLSMLALSMLSPGVPDIYWGTESWMFSLVDPDNRRVPDMEGLEKMMSSLRPGDCRRLLRRWQDGAIKLWLMRELLRLRREVAGAPFQMAPLPVAGTHKRHVVAWLLTSGKKRLAVMALCYPGTLAEEGSLSLSHIDWGNTGISLPAAASPELLTGRKIADGKAIAAQDAFALLPVAVVRLQN